MDTSCFISKLLPCYVMLGLLCSHSNLDLRFHIWCHFVQRGAHKVIMMFRLRIFLIKTQWAIVILFKEGPHKVIMMFCRLLQPIWLEQINHYLAHTFFVLWENIRKHALRFEHLSCYIFLNYIILVVL
jgi:hypothetical protein